MSGGPGAPLHVELLATGDELLTGQIVDTNSAWLMDRLWDLGVMARRKTLVADASPIVIDEVAGYLVTMAFFPWSWGNVIAGFLLFRVMDVAKPWPASALDRVKSGFGVVMDDVAAGVYAGLALGFVKLGLTLLLGCSGGLHWWCMELLP